MFSQQQINDSVESDLNDIKELVDFKITPHTLFFKKYSFRVELKIEHVHDVHNVSLTSVLSNASRSIPKLDILLSHVNILLEIANQLLSIDTFITDNSMDVRKRYSAYDERNLLYFTNSSDMLLFTKKFRNDIVQIVGPISANHDAIIKDSTNVVVRDMLYFGKFRYSLKFEIPPGDSGDALYNDINAISMANKRIFGDMKRMYGGTFKQFITIYLTNLTDFITIKMMHTNYVICTNAIKTVKELSEISE